MSHYHSVPGKQYSLLRETVQSLLFWLNFHIFVLNWLNQKPNQKLMEETIKTQIYVQQLQYKAHLTQGGYCGQSILLQKGTVEGCTGRQQKHVQHWVVPQSPLCHHYFYNFSTGLPPKEHSFAPPPSLTDLLANTCSFLFTGV